MRRNITSLLLSTALVLSLALVAGAGSFHFKSGTFSARSLIFDGVAVGLGNGVYDATLTGTATVTANCENKGGTQASGRNDLHVSVSSNSETITTDSNGLANVTLTVEDPTLGDFDASPSKKDAGCPNGNWSVTGVTVAEWTAAHVVVTEVGGGTVFDQAYDCSGVGATLECHEA